MGRILTRVTIGGFVEPEREIHCDALVDTGAYSLTLPAAWKSRLGPLPVSREVEAVTADRRVLNAEIAGPVTIRIEGFKTVTGEVLFLPTESEDASFEPLIGYITLEQAGIVVDMVGHRLVPAPHFDLKSAPVA